MQDIIIEIWTTLNIPNIDVYFLFVLIILFWLACFLWIRKIYDVFFWLVLWIAIFIVLQYLLLNPNLTVPTFIDKKISEFIVWTSIYLIIILSILVPINWSLHIKESKNKWIRIIETIILSLFIITFYLVIIAWFIEKTYIYNMNNAFEFIKKLTFWQNFSWTSKIYSLIKQYIPIVTLSWVFLVIYKILFSDIINLIIKSIFEAITKIFKSIWKWWGWGWGWWDSKDHSHWHH